MSKFIGSILKSYSCFNHAATAGAGTDNTLVTGANVEGAGYNAGKLVVGGVVALASGKKITSTVTLQHSENGSDWTSIPVTEAEVWKTASGAAYTGVLDPIEYDFNRNALGKYIRALGTFDLDASGTDTSNVGAMFVLSGGWENPISRAE